MSNRTARIIGGIGRTFIGAGLLVMAFALFQLWGTGLQEERAQNNLDDAFEARLALVNELTAASEAAKVPEELASADPEETEKPTNSFESAAPKDGPQSEGLLPKAPTIAPELAEAMLPKSGEVMGRIEIPILGVKKAVVQGVRRSDLREGPGHYPDTVFPGQAGNSAIAGHRTTYGSPFGDLDLLSPGDNIIVETLQGKFYYEVLPQTDPATGEEIGHQIVSPWDIEVLDDFGDNRLTLTACHPKYSARERIVVAAKLVSEPAARIAALDPIERPIDDSAPDGLGFDEDLVSEYQESESEQYRESEIELADGELTAEDFEGSLGWQMEELPGVLMWAFGTFLVGLAAWFIGRKWKRLPAYAAATVPFLAMLWVCFEHLDRLLPAF